MCPEPETVANGNVRAFGNTEGSVAHYACDSNYELVGRSTITCSNGQWSHEAPTCECEN